MITFKESDNREDIPWKFPKHGMGMSSGSVVLFFDDRIGIIVKSNNQPRMPVGRFETDWNMSDFTPCAKGTSTTFTDE